jgi:MYXO-CTERM domain-containing protein
MARIGLAGALGLLATACLDPELTASVDQPIYHGSEDTQPSHAAVVALTWGPTGGYFCSGTLVHESFVLTAAHCLEGETAAGTNVFFGQDTTDGSGEYVAVSELVIHEDYDGWVADIGVVELAAPAPADIAPIPHLPLALALTDADIGATVDYSGFGLTETGAEGRKLHVAGTIESVCEGPGWCDGDLVVPGGFYYSMAGGGPCTGDSGGPTFLLRDGVEYVAGVTSYGDEACTDYGVNTTVSAYAAWIEALLPGEQTETICDDMLDDDGDGDVDCDDADCDCPPEGGDDDGGCGCRAGSRGAAWWLALAAALALRRRRARSRQ